MMMPLMGAVVDFTNHRLLLGRIFSAAYVLSLFPTIFINANNWFAMTIIQFVGVFIGWAQASVAYAYLPDLTDDEAVLTGYTRAFTVMIFSSVVVYLGLTVGIGMAVGQKENNIFMARFGMSAAFALSLLTEWLAWGVCLKRRPASRELPAGQTLWTIGFTQVYHTSRTIVRDYKALMWFYISKALSQAAITSLSTIAITFYTDQLQMNASQNGVVAAVMLMASIPGAFLSEMCTKRLNPIRSSIVALVILIATTAVVVSVLRGAHQLVLTALLAACWGIGIGWKLTVDEVIAASIIPEGQDAELMSIYLFSGEVIGWLPPLLFTILNEAGLPQQYGVGCLMIFWLLSIVALICFGSYDDARTLSNRMKRNGDDVAEIESPRVELTNQGIIPSPIHLGHHVNHSSGDEHTHTHTNPTATADDEICTLLVPVSTIP
jgi:MFS-type transporter involved in bile tolerance (Atg22 family)